MYRLSAKLKNELLLISQRKLCKGELLLFAKAIADSIPLAPSDTTNITLFTLTQRNYIDSIIYGINEYTYLDDEERILVYKLIDEFSLWRFNVAYNPPHIFFKGDINTVIDDMSNLLRYIDVTYMCSVADMVDRANFTYTLFKDLAKEIKLQENYRNDQN